MQLVGQLWKLLRKIPPPQFIRKKISGYTHICIPVYVAGPSFTYSCAFSLVRPVASALTVHFSDSITGCFDGYVVKTMHVHSGAGINIKVGGHISSVGKKFCHAPAHFGSSIAISHFGECFRDGHYSLVSFLFALQCPSPHVQPFVKVGGTCPHALWSMELQPLHVRGMTNTSLCIR